MFDWYTPFCMTNREPTIWNRRCRAIEKELSNHSIRASVSRHTLFDTEYYLVEVSDNKEHINDKKIADALDIPRDWVCLYQYRYNENKWFAILEDELNDEYTNCDGELVFKKPFNLKEYFRNHDIDDFKCKFQSLMGIEVSDWVYDSYTDTVLFRVLNETPYFNRDAIANTLNIKWSSIGAYYLPNDDEFVYAIYLGDG